jgi:hypothetical protein
VQSFPPVEFDAFRPKRTVSQADINVELEARSRFGARTSHARGIVLFSLAHGVYRRVAVIVWARTTALIRRSFFCAASSSSEHTGSCAITCLSHLAVVSYAARTALTGPLPLHSSFLTRIFVLLNHFSRDQVMATRRRCFAPTDFLQKHT